MEIKLLVLGVILSLIGGILTIIADIFYGIAIFSREEEEYIENTGKVFNYTLINNNKFCKKGSTQPQILRATKFDNADEVQELFKKENFLVWRIVVGLLSIIFIALIYLCELAAISNYISEKDKLCPLRLRLHIVTANMYILYLSLISTPVYLAQSINFGECIKIYNSKDMHWLITYVDFWEIFLIILGVIYVPIIFAQIITGIFFYRLFIFRFCAYLSIVTITIYILFGFYIFITIATADSTDELIYFPLFVVFFIAAQAFKLFINTPEDLSEFRICIKRENNITNNNRITSESLVVLNIGDNERLGNSNNRDRENNIPIDIRDNNQRLWEEYKENRGEEYRIQLERDRIKRAIEDNNRYIHNTRRIQIQVLYM